MDEVYPAEQFFKERLFLLRRVVLRAKRQIHSDGGARNPVGTESTLT